MVGALFLGASAASQPSCRCRFRRRPACPKGHIGQVGQSGNQGMQQHPSGAVSRRAGPGRAAAAGPLRGRALAPLTPLIPLSMCRHASLTSRRSLPRCAMPLGLRPVCHAAVVGCEGVDHPALHLVTGLLHTDSILLGLLAPVFATLHLCFRNAPAPVLSVASSTCLCRPNLPCSLPPCLHHAASFSDSCTHAGGHIFLFVPGHRGVFQGGCNWG